tara:strand:+ start:264 stop:467 length:204 start_codon:yes stop_codon:yes gene_type:complete
MNHRHERGRVKACQYFGAKNSAQQWDGGDLGSLLGLKGATVVTPRFPNMGTIFDTPLLGVKWDVWNQ